nr:hypothetical protein [Tanacetum cinerariifolium]
MLQKLGIIRFSLRGRIYQQKCKTLWDHYRCRYWNTVRPGMDTSNLLAIEGLRQIWLSPLDHKLQETLPSVGHAHDPLHASGPRAHPSPHTVAPPSGLAVACSPQWRPSGFLPQIPAIVKRQPTEISAHCSPEVPRTGHAFFPILDSVPT